MAVIDVPMKEYLLWSNCPNNCQFCWQKKMNKPETLLNDEEKIQAIDAVINDIDTIGYTDILIVGGEVYCPQTPEVTAKLYELFDMITARIRDDKTRLLYINTNLLYSDYSMLEHIIYSLEIDKRSRLRFTTSYDISGRYADESAKQVFINSLRWLVNPHWHVSTAVNMILTKPFCQAVMNKEFSLSSFVQNECENYPPSYINTIPYIPLGPDDPLKPTEHEVFTTLRMIEEDQPHYLRYYIEQYDTYQDRVLKEYRKGQGLVECSSSYLDCGHNSNYTKVFDDGSCYVCRIKDELSDTTNLKVLTDEILQQKIEEGKYIISIGDVCTAYIWSKFRKPDYIIIDGESDNDSFGDVVHMIKQNNLKRDFVINDSNIAEHDLEETISYTLHNKEDCIIQVLGEEDGAFMVCMRKGQPGDIIIAGDGHRKCMIYYEVPTS